MLGTGCALVCWAEQIRTPKWRPYRAKMFIALGLSGFIPVYHGVIFYGYMGLQGVPSDLPHVHVTRRSNTFPRHGEGV